MEDMENMVLKGVIQVLEIDAEKVLAIPEQNCLLVSDYGLMRFPGMQQEEVSRLLMYHRKVNRNVEIRYRQSISYNKGVINEIIQLTSPLSQSSVSSGL